MVNKKYKTRVKYKAIPFKSPFHWYIWLHLGQKMEGIFFKFTGQTRHFMTRLDALFVPNNILDCHISDGHKTNITHLSTHTVLLTCYSGMSGSLR